MDFLFEENNNKRINWRFFLLFLLVIFMIGILVIYLFIPSVFNKGGAERIPLVPYDDSKKKVDVSILKV